MVVFIRARALKAPYHRMRFEATWENREYMIGVKHICLKPT